MGVPTVNIGSRQSRRERAENVTDVGYDEKVIVGAVENHLANGKFPSSKLYGDGGAGQRIVDILTDIRPGYDKQITY
jgi:UDP-N-acetylglucosamine 2-epimerase